MSCGRPRSRVVGGGNLHGPEWGVCLLRLRSHKEADVAGVEGTRESIRSEWES